jgi:chemotaxis protein CheX
MSAQELDLNYLTEAMRASALEVFGTMLGIEIEPCEPAPGLAVESEEHGVVSLLGLTGEWTGSGGLCCSAACACWIASQMLFSEYPEVNDEVRDAVGEITNMIVGNFKNSIGPHTGPLGMSTPTVICGREMTTTNGGAHEWIVFPFQSREHSFRMMVQLQPARLITSRAHEAMQHVLVER